MLRELLLPLPHDPPLGIEQDGAARRRSLIDRQNQTAHLVLPSVANRRQGCGRTRRRQVPVSGTGRGRAI
jgi:hypothetical protein